MVEKHFVYCSCWSHKFQLVMLSGLQLKSYAVVTIQGSWQEGMLMIDPALTNGSNGHFYGDLNQFI